MGSGRAEGIPLGRFGEPGDVGPAVVCFASDEASWVTGPVLSVNGGDDQYVRWRSACSPEHAVDPEQNEPEREQKEGPGLGDRGRRRRRKGSEIAVRER